MMFSRTLALTISALPLLAVATPLEARQDCDTGALQCCDSTETVCNSCLFSLYSTDLIWTRATQAGSAAGATLLSLLGIVVQDLNVLIGVTCSPITVIGVGGGSSCSAQTVCCEDNSHVRPSPCSVSILMTDLYI